MSVSKLQLLKDRIRILFKPQHMPKYQNYYLGDDNKKVKIRGSKTEVTVRNAFYDRTLGTYMYWVTDRMGNYYVLPENYINELDL